MSTFPVSHLRRMAASITASTVLAGSALVALALPAPATTLVSCVGLDAAHYDPGLTLTPRATSIHADADYVTCAGGPTSGEGHIDGQSPSASCLTISMPMLTEHASFDNGTSITIDYTLAVTTRVGGFNVVTHTGTVVSGNAYQGATAIKTVQLTPSKPHSPA